MSPVFQILSSFLLFLHVTIYSVIRYTTSFQELVRGISHRELIHVKV